MQLKLGKEEESLFLPDFPQSSRAPPPAEALPHSAGCWPRGPIPRARGLGYLLGKVTVLLPPPPAGPTCLLALAPGQEAIPSAPPGVQAPGRTGWGGSASAPSKQLPCPPKPPSVPRPSGEGCVSNLAEKTGWVCFPLLSSLLLQEMLESILWERALSPSASPCPARPASLWGSEPLPSWPRATKLRPGLRRGRPHSAPGSWVPT